MRASSHFLTPGPKVGLWKGHGAGRLGGTQEDPRRVSSQDSQGSRRSGWAGAGGGAGSGWPLPQISLESCFLICQVQIIISAFPISGFWAPCQAAYLRDRLSSSQLPRFIDKETKAQRVASVSRATQPVSGEARICTTSVGVWSLPLRPQCFTCPAGPRAA